MKRITFTTDLPYTIFDFERFKRNPVIIWNHQVDFLPLGMLEDLDEKELSGMPVFNNIGMSRTIKGLYIKNRLLAKPGGTIETDESGKVVKFTVLEISFSPKTPTLMSSKNDAPNRWPDKEPANNPTQVQYLKYASTPIHKYLIPMLRVLEERQMVAGKSAQSGTDDSTKVEFIEQCNKMIMEILHIPMPGKGGKQ